MEYLWLHFVSDDHLIVMKWQKSKHEPHFPTELCIFPPGLLVSEQPKSDDRLTLHGHCKQQYSFIT